MVESVFVENSSDDEEGIPLAQTKKRAMLKKLSKISKSLKTTQISPPKKIVHGNQSVQEKAEVMGAPTNQIATQSKQDCDNNNQSEKIFSESEGSVEMIDCNNATKSPTAQKKSPSTATRRTKSPSIATRQTKSPSIATRQMKSPSNATRQTATGIHSKKLPLKTNPEVVSAPVKER